MAIYTAEGWATLSKDMLPERHVLEMTMGIVLLGTPTTQRKTDTHNKNHSRPAPEIAQHTKGNTQDHHTNAKV